MRRLNSIVVLLIGSLASPPIYPAEGSQAPDVKGIGIEQHLGRQLPLDAQFLDESGATVTLGKYFNGKPVLFAPVYFACPMLCSQVLSGVVAAMRPLSLPA